MKRSIPSSLLLAAALSLSPPVLAANGSATSASTCWSASVEQQLNACPGVGTRSSTPTHGRVQVRFQPPAPRASPSTTPEPRHQPAFDPTTLRNLRLKLAAPKLRRLLLSEIQGLETLFRSTPRSAPDRVRIARRLAESYVELEKSARAELTRAQTQKNRAEERKAADVVKRARAKAIAYYSLIKNQYSSYKSLDEVLYYLAYEHEQGGDLESARKVYYELIQKTPSSRYVPSAYLAFGELFFGEAQTDASKFELAKQAYEEVIKYPPPGNTMFGYAHYKLAYVHWNQGDFPRALSHFKQTIEFASQNPTLPNAVPLSQAARKDMIPVYAMTGRPSAAYAFFQPLSGDAPGKSENTLHMMDGLGRAYLDTGHYPEAIALYRDLLRRDRGDASCGYHARISEATMAMRSGDKDAIVGVLDEQVRAMKAFSAAAHDAAAKRACRNETAALMSETAMAWHIEAVGSGGVRGTRDPKTMKAAKTLYDAVIDAFTSSEFSGFTFPRLVKQDWPTLFRLKYHRADLLFAEKKWAECGPAFDAVFEENPKAAEARDALYAAMICYQNVFDETHGSRTANAPQTPATYEAKAIDDSKRAMIRAFDRYLCHFEPPANNADAFDQYVEVKYARARTYFEAQHWEQAAVAFRDIAMSHPSHDSAIYAAQLYLESANVLASKVTPNRTGCIDAMAADVPMLAQLHCTGARAGNNAEQCERLVHVECDVKRKQAEDIVASADRGGPGALRKYEQGANHLLSLWKEYGEKPIRAGAQPRCERLDEVVYNACKAYQAGRLVAKSIQCRRILLDPDNPFADSELAHRATYEIGGNYQAIAVYDQAADWYERFAANQPKRADKDAYEYWTERADDALSDAVVLRLGLGHDRKALSDAALFRKYFAQKSPQKNAQIAFAIAAHYVESGKWDDARRQLASNMASVDRHAAYDTRVQAHAMLGHAYAELGQTSRAGDSYRRVVALWSDSDAAVAKIFESAKDEPEAVRVRRLGKALNSVGEAIFFFAEQQRTRDVAPIRFPAYRGGGYHPPSTPLDRMTSAEFQREMDARKRESDHVQQHIDTKVRSWVERKRSAIETVDQEYLKVAHLKPAPPPKWVIASAAAVGSMWSEFVRDFRRAPIPAWMAADDELRGLYYQKLDEASEPIKLIAKSAYGTCLQRSVAFQYFDRHSRSCEAWLAENYRNEYHRVDEFRGHPDLIGSGLNERPGPLDLGGLPHVALNGK